MPVITPQDLLDYSVFPEVQERKTELLEKDILEAENEIKELIGHNFDTAEYETVPEDAKLAYLKLAQFYALINSDESIVKGYESETLGDYSYTLSNGGTIRKPIIDHLLSPYAKEDLSAKKVIFRMRSL